MLIDEFTDLVGHGSLGEIAEVLNSYPRLNLCEVGEYYNFSPFVRACARGDPAIMELFFARVPQQLDVVNITARGWTPLIDVVAYVSGPEACCAILHRMLQVPGVAVDFVVTSKSGAFGWSAFAFAAHRTVGIMKVLIGCGKPLAWASDDLLAHNSGPARLRDIISSPKTPVGNLDLEACQRGRVELLDRFVADPDLTRHAIQLELPGQHGISLNGSPGASPYASAAAHHLFACCVFMCDGYLACTPTVSRTLDPVSRFLAFAERLPMELQALLCHRAMGSGRSLILTPQAEIAFRHLVSILR